MAATFLWLDLVSEFARGYDTDPRLAFLEVGFGLWAEYHIYDPGEQVGVNFPDKTFQVEFTRHMAKEFQVTRWLILKDAHVAERTPFEDMPDLLALPFGIFDNTAAGDDCPGYSRHRKRLRPRVLVERLAPYNGESTTRSAAWPGLFTATTSIWLTRVSSVGYSNRSKNSL